MELLTTVERTMLSEAERHDTGGFDNWRKEPRQRPFVVDIDARPLMVLIDSAAHGVRLYELMSIRRPGDVLHYLWVTFVDMDEDVVESIKEGIDHRHPYEFDNKTPLTGVPFVYFDECFIRQGDDTYPEAATWRHHIDRPEWRLKLTDWFGLICKIQTRLHNTDDYLLQNEMRLVRETRHRLDFTEGVERRAQLVAPDFSQSQQNGDFYGKLRTLISQDDVHSVSCPFGGLAVWRILVEEQVRRAQSSGLPLQEAFNLAGPDHGLGNAVVPEDWGGEVHIPYEGMCIADLTFLPGWRKFTPEFADIDGSLTAALNSGFADQDTCRYLFVPRERDFGELGCAIRDVIDDHWVLYRSK
jgi:hypothetical protein